MRKRPIVYEKTIQLLEKMYDVTGGKDFTITDLPEDLYVIFGFTSRQTFVSSFFRYGERAGVLEKIRYSARRNLYRWIKSPGELRRSKKPRRKRRSAVSVRGFQTNRSSGAVQTRRSRPPKQLSDIGLISMSDDARTAFDLLGEERFEGAGVKISEMKTGKTRVKKSFFDTIDEVTVHELIAHKVLVPVGDGTVGNGFNNQVWEADVFRYRDIAAKLKAKDEYLTGCGFPDVRRLSEDDVSGFSFSKLELLLQYMGKILDIANDNQEIIRSALEKRKEGDRLATGEFFQELAKAKRIPTAVLSYLQRNPEAIKEIVGNLPDPEVS